MSSMQTEDTSQVPVQLEYYQPAFQLLHLKLGRRIQEAATTEPRAFVAGLVKAYLSRGTPVPPRDAWPEVRKILDMIEGEIGVLLRSRSVFFWLHVYRRIGVMLSRDEEGEFDPRSVWLVRQIVELAIFKYGRASDAAEIVLSNRVNPDRILGGYMRDGARAIAPSQPSKFYRKFVHQVQSQPQWVIKDFAEEDFINIYRVEGLAVQYWRLTALMRCLGKGVPTRFNDDGTWAYCWDDDLALLIRSIDGRTASNSSSESLLGTWADGQFPSDMRNTTSHLLHPAYNVFRAPVRDAFAPLGLVLADDYVPNFIVGSINLSAYLEAHKFLFDAFEARHGYRLETFVAVLWALEHVVLFPRSSHCSETKLAKSFREGIFHLMRRGYDVINAAQDRLVPQIRDWIKVGFPHLDPSAEELSTVVERLALTPAVQGSISLWSGGPRYLIVPAGFHHAVDFQGLAVLLDTLFVRLSHDQSHRGTIFEEAFRRALQARSYDVRSGKLKAPAGERELDAGVVLGNTLYVFECVSVERPLDYEIGNPQTIKSRCERLDKKVDQTLSLAEFLSENRKGANYDFSNVTHITPLVVSPFEEWIWDRSSRLWLDEATPRILSANEALELLSRMSA
jgi:hypothetical protein